MKAIEIKARRGSFVRGEDVAEYVENMLCGQAFAMGQRMAAFGRKMDQAPNHSDELTWHHGAKAAVEIMYEDLFKELP